VVTNYTGTGISGSLAITAGPDGALWFTNPTDNSIGRITTAGVVTNYANPTMSYPFGITAGPDGALWFTNAGNGSIGRITTAGVVTNYTGTGIAYPEGITAGPDGALWFTNAHGNSTGRITTAGVVTNYSDPTVSYPFDITTGPDGALWFTNNTNSSIGRITTAGVVTNYTDPTISGPYGITGGSDGALWFTNSGNNSIGRITTPTPQAITSPVTANATTGSPFSFTVTTTGTPVPSITNKGKLPKGLKLTNNSNGTATMSGTPTKAGTYHFTIEATFGTGKTKKIVTQAFALTVDPMPTGYITPGSQWTLSATSGSFNGDCEVQTFSKVGHTWTADQDVTAGTYSGGGTKIEEKATVGKVFWLTATGTYSAGTYSFTFSGGDVKGASGLLTPGATAGC
jgi:sugar lactone lactonase YvrE